MAGTDHHRTLDRLCTGLVVPVVAGPMFLVSGPDLVIASGRAGILGSVPALNARTGAILDGWLTEIGEALGPVPYAVNLIMHETNRRLPEDLAAVVSHRVPVIIASVGSPAPVIEAVSGYGGLVLSDVASVRHAKRALSLGAHGLILLCAGAGGNTGWLNPFAFLEEVRSFYDGPVVLAGGLTNGRQIRAAELLGADLALLGTRFIAAEESLAAPGYREMLVESGADDITLTAEVTGIPANMLRKSLERSGFTAKGEKRGAFDLGHELETLRAWRDIWSAGHGVGGIREVRSTAEIVRAIGVEYAAAGGVMRGSSPFTRPGSRVAGTG